MSSRVRRWTIAACAAAMFVPLAVPLAGRKVFTQYDLAWFHLPLRFLYQGALREGDSILWTPSLFTGFYVHGEGQVGGAHPLHLALYWLLPLDIAFNLELATSYVMAFAGMFVLLRRFALSREASGFGALIFAFSGFNLLHLNHMNAVAVCSHVPWLLLACDMMLRPSRESDRAWGFPMAAAAVGSQILLGYPQYVWMTLVAVGAFAGCRARTVAGAVLAGGALVAGAAIGAAQLLPTFEAVSQSGRNALPAEYKLAFPLTYSLHPLNLVQLWSPYAYPQRIFALPGEDMIHEHGVYDGAFATVAIFWIAMRFRTLGSRRSIAAALLAMLALAIALAFGRWGGLSFVLARVPVVGTFRAPARYIFLVHLVSSGLAALAFDDLAGAARQRPGARTLWPLTIVALLSVLTLAVATFAPDATSAWVVGLSWSAPIRVLAGTAIVALVVMLTALAARGRAWALVVLIPVTALDLGLWGYGFVWHWPPEPVQRVVERASRPPEGRPGDTVSVAIPSAYANELVMSGFKLANGYAALSPALRLLPWEPVALRLAGTRWQETLHGWRPVEDPMPRARLVASARPSASPLDDLRAMDIARSAVVDEPVGPLTESPGTTSVAVDRPGRLSIDVSSSTRQLLLTTERFHPGWRARIDGAAVTPLRVNGDFMGALVEPGAHRVEFVFEPASFRRGVWISAAGVAIAALAFAWLRAGLKAGPYVRD